MKGTKDFGIRFGSSSGVDELEGFIYAYYAEDLDSRRSTTRFIFMLFGGPVSWRSTLQQMTTLSTTEAEYMAMSKASKEAL